ncbi:PadR family transcriptional regulator [Variovorax ginsengisoli]|uniref:DNA-binding PadR family transcriptional regulator n=1 Tax=Variovorax ginsengisoli TaxID=363844 RepID=A0ABT9SC39_9BURK|nr:PadR family transcriptional regulator [Variovorax ginsengisoli]MDP9901428.1 DNA-binding PadR family transcriptional regulator [Variovorax ginsengisoli]
MRHAHFRLRIRRGEHGDGLSGGAPAGDTARGGRHGGGGGGRGGRIFGHGGLRFVLLQLIADKPAHGYELIKAIEDRLGGSYAPSPGIVYPSLTLLEELGHLSVDAADGSSNRRRYSITDSGREFLEANRTLTDELMARMNSGVDGAGPRGGRPPQVMRAIENLKLAMRMRLSGEPLTPAQANAFAAVLDSAAQQLEQI